MKKISLILAIALCGCLNAFPQATSLTVDCQTPGCLSSLINYGDQQTLENIKVTGYINGKDLAYIGSLMDYELNGKIDLTEVEIVNNSEDIIKSFSLKSEKHLSRLDLPSNLTDLKSMTTYLSTDTLVIGGEGLPEISSGQLNYLNPVSIIIREGVKRLITGITNTNINYRTLENGFTNTKSIVLPSTLKTIEPVMFAKSTKLQSVNIPDSVEEIGRYAFAGTSCFPKTVYMPCALKELYLSNFIDAMPEALYLSENTTCIDNSKYYDDNGNSSWFPYLTGYKPVLLTEPVEIHIKSKTIPVMKVADGTVADGANNNFVYNNCIFYVKADLVDQYKQTNFYKNGMILAEREIENLIVDKKQNYYVGDKVNLKASYEPLDATDVKIKWVSKDSSVIMLSEEGEAECKKSGHTIVTASTSYNRVSEDVEISVFEHTTGVEIDKKNLSINVGQSEIIKADVFPIGLSDGKVLWKSSNEEIAMVDSLGKVTALKPGECVITCVTKDRGYKAYCNVKIVKPVTGIFLSTTQYKFTMIGECVQLEAIVNPDDATDKGIRWSCSDENVCVVKQTETSGDCVNKAVVMSTGTGSCTITATSVDGGYTATCEVTVTQPVEALTLEKHSISLMVGESEKVFAQINPATADNKTIVWVSSNEEIASVNADGTINALKGGEAWIKAVSQDNVEAKDSCKVTVTQPVTGIALSKESVLMNNVGKSVQLNAVLEPADATNKAVRWSSTNTSVCTVAKGYVVATGYGTAVVLASTVDGGFMAACTVTVDPATEIADVQHEGDTTIEYYNINGVKIENPNAPGIYIVRQADGRMKKIIKK